MALVVTAKQPFLDWLQSVDPTGGNLTLGDLNQDPFVYLLPESASDRDAARHVRHSYKQIFESELIGWWREPSDWPKISSRLFARWFDWRYHSVVLDLAPGALVREEW
jgi:hypothetical protein